MGIDRVDSTLYNATYYTLLYYATETKKREALPLFVLILGLFDAGEPYLC